MYRSGYFIYVKVPRQCLVYNSKLFLNFYSHRTPGIGCHAAAAQRAGLALRDGGRRAGCRGIRSYYRIGVFYYRID